MDFHVYMEGVYNAATGSMNTHLNITRRLLPGQTPTSALVTPTPAGQPYTQSPWSYNGNEGINFSNNDYPADVVDWVLVSLRTSLTADSEVAKAAGLLYKDGRIDLF